MKSQILQWLRLRFWALKAIRDPIDLVSREMNKTRSRLLVAFGESHNDEGTLSYEPEFIRALHNRGYHIKAIFLEEDEGITPDLEEFYSHGEMTKLLENYLLKGSPRNQWQHEHRLALVKLCCQLGVRVYFIDNLRSKNRGADWAKKISEAIGDKVNGLYILIAGRNHVSHSAALYANNNEPVVALLDKKYPGQILSINCQISDIYAFSERDALESNFLRDLTILRLAGKACAIKTKNSPYRNLPVNFYLRRTATVKDAFDILICVPGKTIPDATEAA